MPPDAPSVRGVILAGGASRRMGRDKALVPVAGRPMVMVAAGALADAGVTDVTAVGGDAAALGSLGLAVAPDRWPGEGPLGGLLTGLGLGAVTDIVVVLTCDLVALDGVAVRRLLDTLDSHPDAAGAAPSAGGHPQLLTAAYRAASAGPLQAQFDAGERGVRRAVRASRLDVVDVAGIAESLLADADRPEDLPA